MADSRETVRPAGPGGPPRKRPPHRNVAVKEVTRPTPGLVRVVLAGELEAWDQGTPGSHLKVLVPQGDAEELAMRTYTVRRFEQETGELTVDFGLHGDGPATSWARRAAVGDRIKVSGLARSGWVPDPASVWCLLLADHSALPALAAIAESLPAGIHARAVVELPDGQDELELSSPAKLEVEWLLEAGAPCERLVSAARALTLPEDRGEVWVGCEASAMRQIRAHMLGELSVSPRELHTRAYWKQDVANHPDHDTGEDD